MTLASASTSGSTWGKCEKPIHGEGINNALAAPVLSGVLHFS
jgi:hypothetical protein